MSWEILSPIVIVGSALVLIGLERLFPYDPRQRLIRPGFFTDLIGYGLLQSYVLGLAITALIRGADSDPIRTVRGAGYAFEEPPGSRV